MVNNLNGHTPFSVSKQMIMNDQYVYGSQAFNAMAGNVIHKRLTSLHAGGEISARPQDAMQILMMALSSFKDEIRVPATQYSSALMNLSNESDRIRLDKLLRELDLIHACVVFDDPRAEEAGIKSKVPYSGKALDARFSKPLSPYAINLADVVVYVESLPGDTPCTLLPRDFYSTPIEILNAKRRTITDSESYWAKKNRDVDKQTVNQYARRAEKDRRKDAEKLANLFLIYASNANKSVQNAVMSMAGSFHLLYDQDTEIDLIGSLRADLDEIARQNDSPNIARIAGLLNDVVSQRIKTRRNDESNIFISGLDNVSVAYPDGQFNHTKKI